MPDTKSERDMLMLIVRRRDCVMQVRTMTELDVTENHLGVEGAKAMAELVRYVGCMCAA